MKVARLLAIDPSLTCSGWALFEQDSQKLLGVGKVRSADSSLVLSLRLNKLQFQIAQLLGHLKLGSGDILVCEEATTMRDPHAVLKVEQVRGIFETVARSQGVLVPGRVSPRSVQRELMGLRGRQQAREFVKPTAVRVAQAMFKDALEALSFDASLTHLEGNQDIVDALLVGAYVLPRIEAARASGLSLYDCLGQNRSRRRSNRFGWGKGDSNSFGWTDSELSRVTQKKPETV